MSEMKNAAHEAAESVQEQSTKKIDRKSEKKRPATDAAKKEKRAGRAVVALVCVMALLTVGTASLRLFTDFFSSEDSVKAVAYFGLPAEDKKELEDIIARLVPLVPSDYDKSETKTGAFLSEFFSSGEKLSQILGSTAQKITQTPDPVHRFVSDGEEENMGYYRLEKREVADILSNFGLEADLTLNSENYYYYGGYYYFAPLQEQKTQTQVVTAEITESKRIQDGRYYLVCTLTGEEATRQVYIVAEDTQERWQIAKISDEPIFDKSGMMIKQEEEALYDYQLKTLVIEDQEGYMRYVLRYPEFYGDTAGEKEINRFFSSVITFYRQQAEAGSDEKENYLAMGGDETALPLETRFDGEVTYMSDQYICVANEISESPLLSGYGVSDDDSQQEESKAAVLGERIVECYTFDIATGDYVNKDTILGKDYQTITELLYRIYNGYDYADLFSEEADKADVPKDSDKQGEKIYESAGTFCKDGYMFCYVTEEGYREDVVIPFDTVKELNNPA
ncbi:MAG: hypothetical protein PUC33_07440 [Oscillospiraceae bacterium]|nr:hypothetical protein [Oscillospiraceae bacterium]